MLYLSDQARLGNHCQAGGFIRYACSLSMRMGLASQRLKAKVRHLSYDSSLSSVVTAMKRTDFWSLYWRTLLSIILTAMSHMWQRLIAGQGLHP